MFIEQVGNYVKLRLSPLPETADSDFDRIHISEFSMPTKGSAMIAFKDGERTCLVVNGDAEAQSIYGDDMAALIAAMELFMLSLEETGTGGGGTQVQSDWNQASSGAVDFIKNKPTIPAAQIQSDWNQSNNLLKDFIKNKPSIPSAPDLTPYLHKSGADVGAASQAQEFTEGIFTPISLTAKTAMDTTGVIAVDNTAQLEATLKPNGEVSATDNGNSTYTKLKPDGGILQTSVANAVTCVVETRSVKVSLTSAEVKALKGTEFTLVGAPGAGKVIKHISSVCKLNFVSAPYSEVTIYIFNHNIPVINPQAYIYSFLLGSSVSAFAFGSSDSNVIINEGVGSLKENEALVMLAPDEPGDSGDGTLDIYLTYQIITL